MTRFLPLICVGLGVVSSARAGERRMVDEVVAVVEAQSITRSDVEAETRIWLAESRGPSVAMIQLDSSLLAASLRRQIEERVVLAEIERLRLFDLEPTERELLLRRLRGKFASVAAWEQFLRKLEMTEEEVGGVLARGLRVVRYLDNRLKLAAQPRDADYADAVKELGKDAPKTQAARDALRARLTKDRYEKMLLDLLAELRKRANVRVLDPLEGADPVRPQAGP